MSLLSKSSPNRATKKNFEGRLPEGIPEDVKIKAFEIKEKISKITRKKNLVCLNFYCVQCAYEELELEVPIDLHKKFNLTDNEAKKANRKFREEDYCPPQSFTSPLVYCTPYGKELNFNEDMIEDLENFTKRIIAKNPNLYQHYPNVVMGAIIAYYSDVKKISLSKEISEITNKSNATINNMKNIITIADNS